MEWALSEQKILTLFILGFEKAYGDRVSNYFLKVLFLRIGLITSWNCRVATLYKSAMSVIPIAGCIDRSLWILGVVC